MQNDHKTLLDNFAGIALNALIQKMDFLDIKGKVGRKVEADEMARIKKELTGAAYEYASWMLIARKESLVWIEENKEKL